MNTELSLIVKPSVEDFEILHFLGKGSYGKVYQVRKKCGLDENHIYAMKTTKKIKMLERKKKIERAFTERDVLKTMEHPFIVKIMYSFQSDTKLYLILEYLCGGDLQNLLKKEKFLPESSARFYLTEIILAIEYLHSRDIIFRDLKPANILLDKYGHIKIVDFGLSKENIRNGQQTYSTCGTLVYSAPEIINKDGHSKQVDWWSLGILTFKMLTGKYPFPEIFDENILAQSIVRGVYYFPLKFEIKSAAKELVQQLLICNPELRLGSSGAKEIKKHKFFKEIRWKQVLYRLQKPPHVPQLESMTDVSAFTKKDSQKSATTDFVPISGITKSQNKLFDGFSFTSREILQMNLKNDTGSNLCDEARLPENSVGVSNKLSNILKSIKSFFNKTN